MDILPWFVAGSWMDRSSPGEATSPRLLVEKVWLSPDCFRACLFGLWLAGYAEKAVVQRKLLCRKSCCFEFHCLATWLAVWAVNRRIV
jgi:hypothetical protein